MVVIPSSAHGGNPPVESVRGRKGVAIDTDKVRDHVDTGEQATQSNGRGSSGRNGNTMNVSVCDTLNEWIQNVVAGANAQTEVA